MTREKCTGMEQLAVSHVTAQQFQQQSYTHVKETKERMVKDRFALSTCLIKLLLMTSILCLDV